MYRCYHLLQEFILPLVLHLKSYLAFFGHYLARHVSNVFGSALENLSAMYISSEDRFGRHRNIPQQTTFAKPVFEETTTKNAAW